MLGTKFINLVSSLTDLTSLSCLHAEGIGRSSGLDCNKKSFDCKQEKKVWS